MASLRSPTDNSPHRREGRPRRAGPGRARSVPFLLIGAAAVALGAGCDVARDVSPGRVWCSGWAAAPAAVSIPDGPAAVAHQVSWALADAAGRHLLYRAASRLVARRLATGEEREVFLGDGLQVFPTSLDGGRVLASWTRARDGLSTYYVVDVERCSADATPIVTSTSDPRIGYSVVTAVALSGDRVLYGVDRGIRAVAEAWVLDLRSMEQRELACASNRVDDAALDGDWAVRLEESDGAPPSLIASDDVTGASLAVPLSTTVAKGLAASGGRAVWVERRASAYTIDSDVMLIDLASGAVTPLTPLPSTQDQPTIRGRLVAWSDDRDGDFDVRVRDLATGIEQVVAASPEDERAPVLTDAGLLWMVPHADGATVYLDARIRP